MRPLVAALLALALAAPVALTLAHASPSVRGGVTPAMSSQAPPPPYTEFYLSTYDLLPAPTSWFAVPIVTDRVAYVRIETEGYSFNQGGLQLAQPILAIEGDGMFAGGMDGFGSIPEEVEIAREGETLVVCCDNIATSWSSGTNSGSMAILLAPGQTLWIGLAAYEWDDAHSATFIVSGQALLTMGEPRTGARVEAVDLFDEARRAGTFARAPGVELQPTTGAAERTWTSERYGLFSVYASAWGSSDASARLRVEMPGVAPSSTTLAGDAHAYANALRAGTYRVSLSDLELPAVSRGEARLDVYALFADIDVPGDAAFIYP